MQMQGELGSLWDPGGTMYGHGLASIVLCEAYGMTHDQVLEGAGPGGRQLHRRCPRPAVAAAGAITRDDPGDTSVVGWQLMALKSAEMAYLHVPPGTMRKAGYFLDSRAIRWRRCLRLSATRTRRRPATTAIGLLCRMYLGWEHDNEALQRGVQILDMLGPSTDNRRGMTQQHVLQLLRHAGHAPLRRLSLAALERGDARLSDRTRKHTVGHEARQLVSRRLGQRGSGRRAAVLHGHGRHDAGSLLSPHAALSRSKRSHSR